MAEKGNHKQKGSSWDDTPAPPPPFNATQVGFRAMGNKSHTANDVGMSFQTGKSGINFWGTRGFSGYIDYEDLKDSDSDTRNAIIEASRLAITGNDTYRPTSGAEHNSRPSSTPTPQQIKSPAADVVPPAPAYKALRAPPALNKAPSVHTLKSSPPADDDVASQSNLSQVSSVSNRSKASAHHRSSKQDKICTSCKGEESASRPIKKVKRWSDLPMCWPCLHNTFGLEAEKAWVNK